MPLQDKNEITSAGKFWAGVFLIAFTALPVFFIIGLWPDQMPEPKASQWYARGLFHVTLIKGTPGPNVIHLNTILFLLVALSGFLGTMIHLATSFTNFVGSEKFKRSWVLWYFVKPFTGTAVALIFYFVLKAGLLNFDAGGGANPYGIVILSALAGLFTDKATLKLEEIFTTLFKPKDDRPNKLDASAFTVDSVEPKTLSLGIDNKITIKGKGFDSTQQVIKIGEIKITPEQNSLVVTPTLITFQYKIDPVVQDQKEIALTITGEKDTAPFSEILKVQEVFLPESVEEDAFTS